jgi:hypothetical protein
MASFAIRNLSLETLFEELDQLEAFWLRFQCRILPTPNEIPLQFGDCEDALKRLLDSGATILYFLRKSTISR